MRHNWKSITAILGVCLGMNIASHADVVYDNSQHAITNLDGTFVSHYTSSQYGDEINLTGTQRYVTQFLFEYYAQLQGPFGQGDETVQVRFYANNGGLDPVFNRYQMPGDLLWDSGPIPIVPGGHTLTIPVDMVLVPDQFTWTVQFGGMSFGNNDRAGLLIYNPPTIGADLGNGVIGSFNDFWQVVNGQWNLVQFSNGNPGNFNGRVVAVPEPGVFALAAFGSLLCLGWRRLRKHTRPVG